MYKLTSSSLNTRSATGSIADWFRNRFSSSAGNKQFMVHPCLINGRPTLVYEKDLATTDPQAFAYLRNYAALNGHDIKEDRRSDFIEGVKRVKDKHGANIITLMVLSACLYSSPSRADAGKDGTNIHPLMGTGSTQTQKTDNLLNLNFSPDTNISETELMVVLLRWVQNNSSFKFTLDELPKIKKVSHLQIAHIAFGKELPASVNPDTLGIMGLYNFHDQSIYILDTLDLNSEGDRAILLHELVHFLQYQAGNDKGVQCKNELERLAYTLEAKYLEAHKQKVDFNDSHIAAASQCT